MVVFDASVLSLAIYENAGVPSDFRTGNPIDRAAERVHGLIRDLSAAGETIVIPAPALTEALTPVADRIGEYLNELESQSVFRIVPFDKREAIELAIRSYNLKTTGVEKCEGVDAPWQKVKYDRQIVAIAKTENAAVVYSTDRHIHKHCELWKIQAINVSDLPVSTAHAEQEKMFQASDNGESSGEKTTETRTEAAVLSADPLRGSSSGHSEGEAGGETETGGKD